MGCVRKPSSIPYAAGAKLGNPLLKHQSPDLLFLADGIQSITAILQVLIANVSRLHRSRFVFGQSFQPNQVTAVGWSPTRNVRVRLETLKMQSLRFFNEQL